MTTTYVWTINSLSVVHSPNANTPDMASFTINGDDGTFKGQVTYSVNLLPPDPAAPPVALEALTEEQAIAMVQAALGEDRVTAMQAEVQAQITAQETPAPEPVPLPWATSPDA